MAKVNPTTYRLSETCIKSLDTIAKQNGLSSRTAAIEYLAEYFINNALEVSETKLLFSEILHQLELLKRYDNEIRRNDYLVLDLLNTLCFHFNITDSLAHDDKRFQTAPYIAAKQNLNVFLQNVQSRIKGGNTSGVNDEQEIE